jgi:glycosyltransferase involved in cell wall biosynthesis
MLKIATGLKLMPDNRMNQKKMVILFNSFITLSGGDVRLLEVTKRINSFDKIVVTSPKGKDVCESSGLDAKYILTAGKSDGFFKNVFFAYFIRIMNALFLKLRMPGQNVLYSSSDFLPDVLPAFVIRNTNKNFRWVQQIYHLIPSPTRRDGPFFTNLMAYTGQRISLNLIKRNADFIFVLNTLIKNQLVKLGFPENKIYVIGAGINLGKIDQVQRIEGTVYDACFLGRLHKSKGIFDLIEIWKLVISKKKKAKLAIIYVGPKDLELAMIKRIKEENLASNVFMLPLTGKEALSVVKSSKIFVFPSHEEGWGIAIAEAMACSLPVVAYNLPVYMEIFSQGMLTAQMNNIKRFSQEVLSLLENEDKAHALGCTGRTHVAVYDWDNVAARELAIMEKDYKNK